MLKSFFLLGCFFIFISCSPKEPVTYIDCNKLIDGLVNADNEAVRMEFNKILSNLEPQAGENDLQGHLINFETLIETIEEECHSIEIELICYACIKTNPLQSEILVKLDSLGVNVQRVVDISTPDYAVLKYLGMHGLE